MRLTKLIFLTTFAIILSCCQTVSSENPGTLVMTAMGPIQGITTKDENVFNFKGIPYAKPPLGKLRWSPPEEIDTWTEVKTANSYGNRCMQPDDTEDGYFNRLIEGHGLNKFLTYLIKKGVASQKPAPMSEDCLYLNIRTDNTLGSKKDKKLKPVMVWIHGGGHQFGSSDLSYYQSNTLVNKGVVLVTINYMLGVMGYMAHPSLSKSDPNGVSGNYGTLDQIAALEWIQKNINSFGGDPNNVTIFGESAGAWSVTELMATPLAKGLFHKAIGQSGASSYHMGQMDGEGVGWPSGYQTGLAVIEALGLKNPTSKDLRAISAEKIQSVVTEKMSEGFHHIRDGYVFPENVGLAFSKNKYNKVPMLFGYNSDEGTLFFPDDEQPTIWLPDLAPGSKKELSTKLKEFFPVNYEKLIDLYKLDEDFTLGGTQWMGDEIFGVNIRYVTRQNENHGGESYLYHFSRVPPSSKQTIGAFHAAEIPFVFGSYEKAIGYSKEDIKLAELMQNYWVNFAKNGNPNGGNLPEWPLHKGKNWMKLTANTSEDSKAINYIREEKLNALEEGLLILLTELKKTQPVGE